MYKSPLLYANDHFHTGTITTATILGLRLLYFRSVQSSDHRFRNGEDFLLFKLPRHKLQADRSAVVNLRII